MASEVGFPQEVQCYIGLYGCGRCQSVHCSVVSVLGYTVKQTVHISQWKYLEIIHKIDLVSHDVKIPRGASIPTSVQDGNEYQRL